MFDPVSAAIVAGIVLMLGLSLVAPALMVWPGPALRMRRLERRAAAGDPEAQQSMRFLQDLTTALNAGGPADLQRREQLMASGLVERAIVRAVIVGGTRVDRGGTVWRPVELTLELGSDRRTVSHVEYVDELYVSRLLVGADVPVYVDRTDPETLTIGWDRA
jgi:hypothetical protein